MFVLKNAVFFYAKIKKLIRICLLINEKKLQCYILTTSVSKLWKISHKWYSKFVIGPVQSRSMLEISTYLQSKYLHTESTSSYF